MLCVIFVERMRLSCAVDAVELAIAVLIIRSRIGQNIKIGARHIRGLDSMLTLVQASIISLFDSFHILRSSLYVHDSCLAFACFDLWEVRSLFVVGIISWSSYFVVLSWIYWFYWRFDIPEVSSCGTLSRSRTACQILDDHE